MDYNGLDTIYEAVEGISDLAFKVDAKCLGARDDLSYRIFELSRVSLLHFAGTCLRYHNVRSQESSFLRQNPGHEVMVVKANCIRKDFERVYAELARADARRVVWSILNRSYECDVAVARLMCVACSLDEILSLEINPELFRDPGNIRNIFVDCLGIALWRATCNITYSPTPSAPPPPYTLYASNIELPPIEWPDTNEPEVRLWSTKSEGSCKRSPVKETQTAIIQNLLRLADDSSAVSEPEREPRIVEILEDSEEEGGAPLSEFTRVGCISPTLRQKQRSSPLPKKYISRATPEDMVFANKKLTSTEHQMYDHLK